jgi:disulfide bond formation protein DsbB
MRLVFCLATIVLLAVLLGGCIDGSRAAGGDAAKGRELFVRNCARCHGPEGQGALQTSSFVATRSDAELVAFLRVGRAPDDPLNTTGVAMPPKGGNPALTDEHLADIVAYIRTLQRGKR